jgi:hypothetical protein
MLVWTSPASLGPGWKLAWKIGLETWLGKLHSSSQTDLRQILTEFRPRSTGGLRMAAIAVGGALAKLTYRQPVAPSCECHASAGAMPFAADCPISSMGAP